MGKADPRSGGLTINRLLEAGLLLTGTGIIVVHAAGRRALNVPFEKRSFVLISLFALWASLSALWAPSPTLSVAKAGELWLSAVASLCVASLARHSFGSRATLIDVLALALVIVLGILVLANMLIYGSPFAFKAEDWSGRVRLHLAYAHPLIIGDLVALAMICIFVSKLHTAIKVALLPALSIIFFLTDSREGMVALAAALVAMLLVRIHSKDLTILVAFTLSVMIGGILYANSLYSGRLMRSLESSLPEDANTLDGRTDLWMYAWELIKDRPFQGYGYYATRFYIMDPFPWAGHLHNAFIETQFTVGLPGTLLSVLLMLYIASIAVTTRCHFLVGTATYCYIVSFLDPLIFTPCVPMVILMIGLMIAVPSRRSPTTGRASRPSRTAPPRTPTPPDRRGTTEVR